MKEFIIIISFILFSAVSCVGNHEEIHENESQQVIGQKIQIGEYKRIYNAPYINDHSVIYDEKLGKWHMFGIYGKQGFIHLTSDKLTNPNWVKEASFKYNSTDIWAPHIVFAENQYWMFFTAIGDPREIALSRSVDLNNWDHYLGNPLLAYVNEDGSNGKYKDPMVFRWNEQWIIYYSMVVKHENGHDYWAVGCRTSKDLIHWDEPKTVFNEFQPSSPGVESPFVVQRGDSYFLFLSARPWNIENHNGGVDVFESNNPFFWNPKTDHVARFSKEETGSHAPEIVQDLDDQFYITRVGLDAKGFWIAPLIWND